MSKQVWFCSDHHLGHGNILGFVDNDGLPVRVFKNQDEMNETIIERHNSVVKPNDRVYFLGDVAIARKNIKLVDRMNGKKVLIKGNHDIFPLKDYLPHFEDIRSYKIYPNHGIICSHMPVHPEQLEHRFKYNVHGHYHRNLVKDTFKTYAGSEFGFVDLTPRNRKYLNVCVEQTDYTPLNLEQILEKLKNDNHSTATD